MPSEAEAEASGAAFVTTGAVTGSARPRSRRAMRGGTPSTIRFLLQDEEIAWEDAVHGRISFQGRDLDDFVILRSDNSAIYNLAVVSDDIAMGITHVIRGDDHISNTPKQIALYRALGHEPPVFAHVPMILGADGKKLSKRHGATAVGDYQEQGIFPAAMRNFLALLGWSPGGDREIMPEDEMIRLFTLDGIQKKAAVFDTTKLEWMNGQYLSALPADELLEPVRRQLDSHGRGRRGRDLRPLIDSVKARSRTILHVAEQVAVRLDPSRSKLDPKGEALIRKMGRCLRQKSRPRRRRARAADGGGVERRTAAGNPPSARGVRRSEAGRRDAADPGGLDRVDGVGAGERAAGGGGPGEQPPAAQGDGARAGGG